MIDVLVIVMAIVVVGLVVGSRRMKAGRKRSDRGELLAVLTAVVQGSVSAEQVLTGRYRGYDVQVTLRMADPAPPGNMGDAHDNLVEIVDLRLVGAQGAQPWSVWRSPSLIGKHWQWHFARPDGDLADRLRAAGILDAFERVSPPMKDSLPRIRFMPAPGIGPWLELEVERTGVADPSPERFAAILDAAVAIAEINARANPATTTA